MKALVFSLVLCSSTAVGAQNWTKELTPEFQLGAAVGGGWYQEAWHSYVSGVTESGLYGMDTTFGATGRWGVSTAAPGPALMLALHGDLLSLHEQKRFLIGDGAGLFGLRIPLRDGHQIILAGLLGIAFSTEDVKGPGLTYGGVWGYRYKYLSVEGRYQAFAFDLHTIAPAESAELRIHQLLLSVGVVL